MLTLRRTRWAAVALLFVCMAALLSTVAPAVEKQSPNVVLIMTDDQGYGDLGFHGNPVIQTPHLDRLAHESARLTRFYVSPVCAPTRAALLTGRYNYRTRVTDTYLGRAMMDPDEVTLAERLAAAGYRTGIFGKWHLGDCYPLRAMDQGFQVSLVHRGGGIGQPSDPPDATSYFDPVLFRNGQAERQSGYVSDIITDAAIDFIEQQAEQRQPFFVYLPYNAPHTPLEVPERYLAMYQQRDLSPHAFPTVGQPITGRVAADVIARLYGMITNIDYNVGRLLDALQRTSQAANTIVIFLTDNGPQQPRYNAGLRGQKGGVYEGGIRVPLFVRWPGHIEPADLDPPSAHIDLVPTILQACGVESDASQFDGRSIWPILRGDTPLWPERTLFTQWHRGDVPERYRGFAARDARWKLLRRDPGTAAAPISDDQFELYDLQQDPYEMHNVAAAQPDVVQRLKAEYDRWFDDVCATRGFAPPFIVLGSAHENPVTLTRQDWRGEGAGWTTDSIGHWRVRFAEPGHYRFDAVLLEPQTGELVLYLDDQRTASIQIRDSRHARLGPISIEPRNATIRVELESAAGRRAPYQLTVMHSSPPDERSARE